MSYDIALIDKTRSGQYVTVFDRNFTYNYSPALEAAGFKWSDCDDKTAAEVGVFVNAALTRLQADPEKYAPLIRGGGTWGTIDLLLEFFREFAEACKTHHAAKFTRY